jgi:hypothetical protein
MVQSTTCAGSDSRCRAQQQREVGRLTPKQHTTDATMMPIKPQVLWLLPRGAHMDINWRKQLKLLKWTRGMWSHRL